MASLRSALAEQPDLRGVQQPRIRSVPAYSQSAGIEAIQAYELSGRRLDAWQKADLIDACGELDDHRWAAFEVAENDPRQNGKDEILLARELAGMFVWNEQFIGHSAHLFDTAMDHLEKLAAIIEDVPEFERRIRRSPQGSLVNRSHGHEGITLKNGARIRFRARTRSGSFRGFTGECMIFNEAMDLPDELVGSIMPVLSARSMAVPGPQVWYAFSAVDQMTMPNGMVAARLRAAAISGGSERLAYFERSADVKGWLLAHGLRFDPMVPEIEQITPEMLADPEMWAQANPAMGVRISREHILAELRSPSLTARQFAVERLGIGDPPDVDDEDGRVISAEKWGACACHDETQRIEGVKTFAVDVNPARSAGSIAVAGRRPDERLHFAVVKHAREVDWILPQCVELHQEHEDAVWIMDPRGPAAGFIQPMKDAGLEVVETATQDYVNACAGFFDAVGQTRARYPSPQPELDDAVASARVSTLASGGWKWAPRSSTSGDITSLVAATLALWGAETRVTPDPEPLVAWGRH